MHYARLFHNKSYFNKTLMYHRDGVYRQPVEWVVSDSISATVIQSTHSLCSCAFLQDISINTLTRFSVTNFNLEEHVN